MKKDAGTMGFSMTARREMKAPAMRQDRPHAPRGRQTRDQRNRRKEMMRSHGCCTDASLSCLRDRGDDLVLPFLPWGCNVNLVLMEHSRAPFEKTMLWRRRMKNRNVGPTTPNKSNRSRQTHLTHSELSRQTHSLQQPKSPDPLDAADSLDATHAHHNKNRSPIHQITGEGVLYRYLHEPVTASRQECSLLSSG
ncbi:hypothetical protein TNCV_279931 [Trichonephila clavipes]|nr:hypothetical protein TNCV_279931 [Trichonephila clavipes]